MNAVPIRGDWVGRTIDGRFSLVEWLGASGSSGVYLTEDADATPPGAANGEPTGSGPQKAAIKLIPASPQAEDRLAAWKAAASLSDPHLVRILDYGRAKIDDAGLVYVVTELAEEVLSQIIPERPLTPDEVREMLGPILDVLDYLHSKGFVHAHLKPTNILVVDNEVKLSSDGLLPAGKPTHEIYSNDLYNAPEIADNPLTAAADTWSLGVTIVEALAQELPIWDAATDTEPEVPATLPSPFAEIVRGCLHVDPARRCSLNDIRAMLQGKPRPAEQPAPHALQHPHPLVEPTAPGKIPIVPLIVCFVVVMAIIIALAMHRRQTQTAPLQTETTHPAPPAPAAVETAKAEVANAEVIGRVLPDVPAPARSTIQGKISVTVRAAVDPTGAVANAELASRGPSAYFSRLALESARKWKFKPAQQNGRAVPSTWLLRYQFRRDGTDVTPTQTAP